MGALHLISSTDSLVQALQLASVDDAFLLMGDAAAACESGASRPLHVLVDEVPAAAKPAEHVISVDYAGFVDRTCRHQPIITWR